MTSASLAALLALTAATSAAAQSMPDMPGMDHGAMTAPRASADAPEAMVMMAGALGPYAMMRDASGTAWQPDSTPMDGLNWRAGAWTGMVHGYADLVQDHQGGPRGGDKTFSASMLMVMAQRTAGPGTLTLRTMLSLDPLMGPRGYPLLLQTGETADGKTALVDRQHPHDLFMELAATYAVPLRGGSVFVYAGLPGEPALGPAAFMHRLSGQDDPAAPITHHWLDSTHITYGVVTVGVTRGAWKLEASAFNGREPDQHRWDFDRPRLDSWSARLSWNPMPDWALQVSYGDIHSPEQLEPDVSQRRITASATYNRPVRGGNWQTTFAWGRNELSYGPGLNGFLLESAITLGRHTLFARLEDADKAELFASPDPRAGHPYAVAAGSLGYVYDVPVGNHLAVGVGVVGSADALPAAIRPAYGGDPGAVIGFVRLKIRA